jgi:predicted transcriptional regulator
MIIQNNQRKELNDVIASSMRYKTRTYNHGDSTSNWEQLNLKYSISTDLSSTSKDSFESISIVTKTKKTGKGIQKLSSV